MGASVSFDSQATAINQGLGDRWTIDVGSEASPPTKLIDHNLLPPNDPTGSTPSNQSPVTAAPTTTPAWAIQHVPLDARGRGTTTKNANGTWDPARLRWRDLVRSARPTRRLMASRPSETSVGVDESSSPDTAPLLLRQRFRKGADQMEHHCVAPPRPGNSSLPECGPFLGLLSRRHPLRQRSRLCHWKYIATREPRSVLPAEL